MKKSLINPKTNLLSRLNTIIPQVFLCFLSLLLFTSCSEEKIEQQNATWEKEFSNLVTIDFMSQLDDGTNLIYGDGQLFAVDIYGKTQWIKQPFQEMNLSYFKHTNLNQLVVGGTDVESNPHSVFIGLYSFDGNKIWTTKVVENSEDVWPIAVAEIPQNRYAIATIAYNGQIQWAFNIHILNNDGSIIDTVPITASESGSYVRDIWLTTNQKVFVQQVDKESLKHTIYLMEYDGTILFSKSYNSNLIDALLTNMYEDAHSYLLMGFKNEKGWAIRINKSGILEWDYEFYDGDGNRCEFISAISSVNKDGYTFVGKKVEDASHENIWLFSLNYEGVGDLTSSKYFKQTDKRTIGKCISTTSDKKYLIGGESQVVDKSIVDGYLSKVNPDGSMDQ